jgi:hypothetical protein
LKDLLILSRMLVKRVSDKQIVSEDLVKLTVGRIKCLAFL